MKIGIGADHRGYSAKEYLKKYLAKKRYVVVDFGTDSEGSCDYPDIAFSLAVQVAKRKFKKGILICKTGIGMSITANKVKGAYAALCCNRDMAIASRKHNNANILALGATLAGKSKMKSIVDAWLSTEFEGGRHRRRYNKIRKEELR